MTYFTNISKAFEDCGLLSQGPNVTVSKEQDLNKNNMLRSWVIQHYLHHHITGLLVGLNIMDDDPRLTSEAHRGVMS